MDQPIKLTEQEKEKLRLLVKQQLKEHVNTSKRTPVKRLTEGEDFNGVAKATIEDYVKSLRALKDTKRGLPPAVVIQVGNAIKSLDAAVKILSTYDKSISK